MANDIGIQVGLEGVQKYLADIGLIDRATGRATDSIQTGLDKAQGSFSQLAREIPGVGTAISLLQNPVALLAGGITAAGAAAVTFVNQAARFQTITTSFTTLTGSAETARKTLADIAEFAARTPFRLEEIQNAGRSLIAFGTSGDQVVNVLRRIGDVASGVGAPLGELSEIYGKIQVQGRVFAEDINQLTGRGIPIIQELAKQYGVADSAVKGLVESGAIGFPQIEKAFITLTSEGGKFFNLTEQLSQTFSGKLSTLQDNFAALGLAIGQQLLPFAEKAVDVGILLVQGFDGLGGVINENLEVIILAATAFTTYRLAASGATLANLKYEIGFLRLLAAERAGILSTQLLSAAKGSYSAVTGLLTGRIGLLTVAQNALNFALRANPIGLVITAVGLLAAGIVHLYQESETFRAIVAGVWNVLKDGVSFFADLINSTIGAENALLALLGPLGALVANVKITQAVIAGVVSVFKSFGIESATVQGYLINLVPGLRLFGDTFAEVGENIRGAFGVFSEFGTRVSAAFNEAQKAIENFFGIDILGLFGTAILGPIGLIKDDLFSAGRSIADSFLIGFRGKLKEESQVAIQNAVEGGSLAASAAAGQGGKQIGGAISEGINEGMETQAIARNSLAALSAELKKVKEQIEITDPNSTLFSTLAAQSIRLQSEIDAINSRLKAVDVSSLAADLAKLGVSLPAIQELDNLQKQINEVRDNVEKSPSKGLFTDLITEINTVTGSVATVKQNLSGLGLDAIPSLELLQNRIVDIQTLLATERDETALFAGLSQQAEGLREDIAKTETDLQNLGAEVNPDALAGVELLRAQLSVLDRQIEATGSNDAAFSALVTQAGILSAGIQSVSGNIVSLGDLTGKSLSELETQFRNINEAITLVNPESSGFAVLIEQSEVLRKQIATVKNEIEQIASGVDPDPIVLPIEPDLSKLKTLGIVPDPVPVVVIPEIKSTEVATVTLRSLQAEAAAVVAEIERAKAGLSGLTGDDFNAQVERIGSLKDRLAEIQAQTDSLTPSFETLAGKLGIDLSFLVQNFETAGDAISALDAPLARVLDQLGATDQQILETALRMDDLKEALKTTIGAGLVSTIQNVGKAFGESLGSGKAFAGGMAALLSGLVQTFLVEVPKLIGLFLLQTGVALAFPAGLPFILGGIALLGISGFAQGLLSKIGGAKSEQADEIRFSAAVDSQAGGNVGTTAVGTVQDFQPLDLAALNQSTPPPVIVRVQIGNEDVGEYLNQYVTTSRQITG